MLPSSPASRSSPAHQLICWSAARTSSGGSSQPIRAALPESSAHRSTRAFLAAVSRRSLAFSGATSITARAMAARSPPGVSRAARSRTFASAARASAGSSSAVAPVMSSALNRVMVPSRSAAMVPGSRVCRVWARSSRHPARPRDSASAWASWSAAYSSQVSGIRAGPSGSQPGLGLRRISSAAAASLRAAACASTRSHAHSTPISSASETPAKPSSPAAASAATARPAQPGSTSSDIPGPNAAAGLDDSPGKIRAEPGWPGPRRPVVAASTASRSSAAAWRTSASSSAVSGAKSSYSSGSGGSSNSHTRSSHASRSSAVAGSRSSQARSSSRPGSAGTGSAGMNHIRSE